MSWRPPVLILLAIALIGAGYVYLPYIGWSDSQADARGRAEAYLAAVVGGSKDRGWSLLEGSGRTEYGSEDAYRRLMTEADWSRFQWELRYNGVCDDGECSFVLYLANEASSAPDVAWSDGPGDPGVLVPTEGATDQGEAFIGVRQRGWFGGIGVEVSGVTSATGG
jgi:hypothetical protein